MQILSEVATQIRLAPDAGQLSGPPEQLTFLASGAGLSLQSSMARSGDVVRIAFWNVAANMDVWSVTLDPMLGKALEPPRSGGVLLAWHAASHGNRHLTRHD
jgi:hypothetical protein